MVETKIYEMLDSSRDRNGNMHPFQQSDNYASATERDSAPLIADDGASGGPPVEASICAGCGCKILDRYYLLAVEKQWHIECLKCAECNVLLDVTCFMKEGKLYCKDDYYRLFAVTRCARCLQGISAKELVMRARDFVFHVNCFACVTCGLTLNTGDHFGVKEDHIFCQTHYELTMQEEFINSPEQLQHVGAHLSPSGLPVTPAAPGMPSFYNAAPNTTTKGRPRKRKNMPLNEHSENHSHHSIGMTTSEGMEMFQQVSPQPRQKRIRTSFKHQQIRTMKSYFALNHNPDAKDLKQLAQKTGLTKRVLQVWFQNARAKHRRNMLRNESKNPNGDGTQTSGPDSPDGGLDGDVGATYDASSSSFDDLPQSPVHSELSTGSGPALADLQTVTMDHHAAAHAYSTHAQNNLADLYSSNLHTTMV